MRYILASGSPRRVELIQKLHLPFEIMKARSEEVSSATKPEDYAMELAYNKALEVFERTSDLGERFVLGADTIVVFEGKILGKPAHEAEAEEMLRMLSGKTHSVYTGVSFIWGKDEAQTVRFYDKTDVTFNEISEHDIKQYVASRDPLDKAGGYGIQGAFSIHVSRIEGNYENVIGLPTARIYEELKKVM